MGAAGHPQDALGHVQSGITEIAESQLLPHVAEKQGALHDAKQLVAYGVGRQGVGTVFERRIVLSAGPAHAELSLGDRHILAHRAGRCGGDMEHRRGARHGHGIPTRKGFFPGRRHLVHSRPARIEHLHTGLCQQRAVMRRYSLGG